MRWLERWGIRRATLVTIDAEFVEFSLTGDKGVLEEKNRAGRDLTCSTVVVFIYWRSIYDIIKTPLFRNKPHNISLPKISIHLSVLDSTIFLLAGSYQCEKTPHLSLKMVYVYQSEGVVSEEGANPFLEHLPNDTPVYRYDQQCSIESLLPPYSVEDRFIVLKDFPPEIFAKHEEELPQRCDYSRPLQILIIEMPSQPHEEAACSFEIMIAEHAKKMQVFRRIAGCGATRIDTPDRSKQADRSWKPTRQGRKFPTVALEVGFSETTAKLEKDIAWWINESKGEVRMGVTVDIKGRSGCIEITSWTPAFEPSLHRDYVTVRGRHDVVERHANNLPPPQIAQRVLLKRGRDGSGPTIEGEGLTIPFHTLLLDEPGEGESDFVLTAEMLLDDLAERVWDAIDDAEMIKAKERG